MGINTRIGDMITAKRPIQDEGGETSEPVASNRDLNLYRNLAGSQTDTAVDHVFRGCTGKRLRRKLCFPAIRVSSRRIEAHNTRHTLHPHLISLVSHARSARLNLAPCSRNRCNVGLSPTRTGSTEYMHRTEKQASSANVRLRPGSYLFSRGLAQLSLA